MSSSPFPISQARCTQYSSNWGTYTNGRNKAFKCILCSKSMACFESLATCFSVDYNTLLNSSYSFMNLDTVNFATCSTFILLRASFLAYWVYCSSKTVLTSISMVVSEAPKGLTLDRGWGDLNPDRPVRVVNLVSYWFSTGLLFKNTYGDLQRWVSGEVNELDLYSVPLNGLTCLICTVTRGTTIFFRLYFYWEVLWCWRPETGPDGSGFSSTSIGLRAL